MEYIKSRNNRIIAHLKNLSADKAYRSQTGEFVCDGEKTLNEALLFGAEITCVLWGNEPAFVIPEGIRQYLCPMDIMRNVSPLKNSVGPVFSVKIPKNSAEGKTNAKPVSTSIILENVQDPGNVGTVIRTADAMGTDVVILVGGCADLYNPKTVRATMGGIFRQNVLEMDLEGLKNYVNQNALKLYGAALSDSAEDIRNVNMEGLAVAIGSEGRGLSAEMLEICDGQFIIPMRQNCESLNAAVAASIVMWEMAR